MPAHTADSGRSPVKPWPSLWVWAALLALLTLGFAIDAPALALVEPFRRSATAEMIRQVVRPLGTGHVQIPVALLMLLAGALWSRRLKRTGGWTLLAFAVSGAIANVIKVLVHQRRPFSVEPPPESWLGYLHNSKFQSFPSAETATTFAVALTISAAYPALRTPLVAIAGIVGVARVFVGSHHPSDVVAGAMLGIAVGQSLGRHARRRETEPGGR
jgi:undecaprenyl-diphosphatase